MSGSWKEVARLHFKGERFRDHALDLTALTELRQFQKMVAETAKALWWKANPNRERLPRHFEDRTRLCVRTIVEGSAVAPLEVYIEEPDQGELWEPEPVEVNEAIGMVYRVFESFHGDAELPAEFPKELLPEYKKLGEGLSTGDVLQFAPSGKAVVPVSPIERERLILSLDQPYEDQVDVTGQVLEVDVRQRRFQLWQNDRSSIQVAFAEDQEEEITTALKEHRSVRLRVQGRGKFTVKGALQRISSVEVFSIIRDEEPSFDTSAPAIEDVLAALAAEVPDEEWNRLPEDLTDNLDHYLYGGAQQ